MLKQIQTQSVIRGISPLANFSLPDQYQAGIAIDPDFPNSDSSIRTSGYIRPTSMAKFSGTEVTGVPLWMVSNPKDTNTYVYANDGKVHVVTSSLAMGTALNSGSALTSAAGNGAAYYDNYAYFATSTNISRYGPLDGSASLTQSVWTGSFFMNDANKALSNKTYPSIRGIAIPNHPMHRHTDNKLYIGDVISSAGGSAATKNQGCLHTIITRQTTVEGDTNNGSTYNAINFPLGYWPTAIESYGTLLAVALIEGTDTTIKQRRAKVAFWDTTSTSFQQITDVEFPDPLITALKNDNGVLYVFSGNASGGVRVSKFAGGYTYQEVAYLEEGVPPFQGAVDHEMNRIVWGGYTTYPEASASVYAYGSKMRAVGTPLHNILKSTSAGANGMVTAVKYLEQANNSRQRPIIGWSDDSAKGLDKISTTYGVAVWRDKQIPIGQPGVVKKIRIPLAQAIAANMTITPTIYTDDGTGSKVLRTINNTNFPGQKNIVLFPDVPFNHNFLLELRWSGTALATVALPITYIIDVKED